MQRVHWDPEFARRSGNPTTFDYGRMRETWMIHLCTDWMGDDAWLWRLRRASSASSTTSETPSGWQAPSAGATLPTATARPSMSNCAPATSAMR